MAKPVPVQSTDESSGLQTILLIGSTGNGKSCLGNFLLDPDLKHITKNQTFRTGRTNKPETHAVKCCINKKGTIQVVDTPGLNEDTQADLRHMMDVVRKLKDLSSISACILCVKFNAKIDAQYKATVAYYSRLFPMLFEGNVLIVLTDFHEDPRTEELRKMQGINVETIVNDTVHEIRCSGNLSFNPPVFMIDCLPVGNEERQVNEDARRGIISYISKTITPISVASLKVAKTDALKALDAGEIKGLDGEIRGYKVRLVEVNAKSKDVLNAIEQEEKRKSEIDGEICRLKDELKDKDTSCLVVAETWSLSQKWKYFQWQSESFELTSSLPIVEYAKWDNGHLEWVDFKVTTTGASGRVQGQFMRGLHATVNLKAHKRSKYTKEIESLKEQVKKKECKSDEIKRDLEGYVGRKNEYRKEIEDLERYIEQKNQKKQALSLEYMTLEEANRRLRDLGIPPEREIDWDTPVDVKPEEVLSKHSPPSPPLAAENDPSPASKNDPSPASKNDPSPSKTDHSPSKTDHSPSKTDHSPSENDHSPRKHKKVKCTVC